MLTTPAFWDLHLHGVAGIDFMHADTDGMFESCRALGKNGTGFYAPTLLTDEPKLLREACKRWGRFLEQVHSNKNYLSKGSAIPLGLHLEGPFLNPLMAGAHPKRMLKAPSVSAAFDYIEAARGFLSIVTLAPELSGAPALIKDLAKAGVRVQMGHTLATSAQALSGVRSGASGITHLYNAMRVHHREPGVLTALQKKLVTAEIITDGVHLDLDFVWWCIDAVGSHLYAVSDGCCAVGAKPGQRDLTLGSLKLKREGDAAVVKATGVLAGGATYLATHPQKLFRSASDKKSSKQVLDLFYKPQAKIFHARHLKSATKNYFDPKTLKFLGSEPLK